MSRRTEVVIIQIAPGDLREEESWLPVEHTRTDDGDCSGLRQRVGFLLSDSDQQLMTMTMTSSDRPMMSTAPEAPAVGVGVVLTSNPIDLGELAKTHPNTAAAIAIAQIIGATVKDAVKATNETVKATVKETTDTVTNSVSNLVNDMFKFWLLSILGTLITFGMILYCGEFVKGLINKVAESSPVAAIFLALGIMTLSPAPLFITTIIYKMIR